MAKLAVPKGNIKKEPSNTIECVQRIPTKQNNFSPLAIQENL
jgi:hypothetical protein